MSASPAAPGGGPDWRALLAWLGLEGVLLAVAAAHADYFGRPARATVFALAGLAAGVSALAAARLFVRRGPGWDRRRCALVFWAAAVGFRLLLLPAAPGDDYWRYRWEGRVQVLAGANPYALSPDAPALARWRDADWAKINHRDLAAVYAPLTELFFAALAAVRAPVFLGKALFAAADLGVVALLVGWADRFAADGGADPGAGTGAAADAGAGGAGAFPAAAAWYAWNPLAIHSFAGGGHFDSLMLLPLAGAFVWLSRPRRREGGGDALAGAAGAAWGAALLGVAIGTKWVPVFLLPAWVLAERAPRRVLAGLAGLTLGGLALAAVYGWPRVHILQPVHDFTATARTNDPLWWLTEALVWPNPGGGNGVYQTVLALVVAGCAAAFRRRGDWARLWRWTLGALLLLSPVLHAWYLTWILPFVLLRPPGPGTWFWRVFAVSLWGYYLLPALNPDPAAPWHQPLWLRLLILLPPVAAAAAAAAARIGGRDRSRRAGPPPRPA